MVTVVRSLVMQLFTLDPGGGSYTLRRFGAPLVALALVAALAARRGRRHPAVKLPIVLAAVHRP